MKIIDPHIHLFDLTQGEYGWLKPDSPPLWPDKEAINKTFSEDSLVLQSPLSLSGFVHIEAGYDNQQPEREIDWLESTVRSNFRSIACIDLTQPPSLFAKSVQILIQRRSVVGVRHILDEQAVEILSHRNTLPNLLLLAGQHLAFECQLSFYDIQGIQALVQLLASLPELKVIINHAGFVETSTPEKWYQWQKSLEMLSFSTQLAVKCSGWEMTDRLFQPDVVYNTSQQCIELLGEHRVMMASNFPLCLFSHSYQSYWQMVCQTLPPSQLSTLCYENAMNWYKFA